MNTDTTPPPATVHRTGMGEVPDYYLGCLVWYDELSEDNCRWCVYDGENLVRCVSRKSAVEYITNHRTAPGRAETLSILVDARMSLNRAITLLDDHAHDCDGHSKMIFQRLAVKLKPVLVELDNMIL